MKLNSSTKTLDPILLALILMPGIFSGVIYSKLAGISNWEIDLLVVMAAVAPFLIYYLIYLINSSKNRIEFLKNSNQIIFTLDRRNQISILNATFANSVECDEFKSIVARSLAKEKITYQSITAGKNLTFKKPYLEINCCLQPKEVIKRLRLIPLYFMRSKLVFLAASHPGYEEDELNTQTNFELVSELDLGSIVTEYVREFNRGTTNTRIVLDKPLNVSLYQDKQSLISLIEAVQNALCEGYLNQDKMEVNLSLVQNPYGVCFSWKWRNGDSQFQINSSISDLIDKMECRIFHKRNTIGECEVLLFVKDHNQLANPNIKSVKDMTFINELFSTLARYLNSKDFSVELLARELGTSRMQLHRKIKSYFDTSPGSLFQNLRMKKAEELLKDSDYRIADVAYMLGYCDQSHFTKAFKSFFGFPPIEYQRLNAA